MIICIFICTIIAVPFFLPFVPPGERGVEAERYQWQSKRGKRPVSKGAKGSAFSATLGDYCEL